MAVKKYTTKEIDNYILVRNEGGREIAFAAEGGAPLLEADGYAFKDLNRNGKLDPYEDWRLPMEERIRDLAGRMSIHQIAGLMLYSAHQSVSSQDTLFAKMFQGTYDGKPFSESGCAFPVRSERTAVWRRKWRKATATVSRQMKRRWAGEAAASMRW